MTGHRPPRAAITSCSCSPACRTPRLAQAASRTHLMVLKRWAGRFSDSCEKLANISACWPSLSRFPPFLPFLHLHFLTASHQLASVRPPPCWRTPNSHTMLLYPAFQPRPQPPDASTSTPLQFPLLPILGGANGEAGCGSHRPEGGVKETMQKHFWRCDKLNSADRGRRQKGKEEDGADMRSGGLLPHSQATQSFANTTAAVDRIQRKHREV